MMLALGVARDLGADHTSRVALRRGPADMPDATPVNPLDIERAGARTIMRAHAGDDVERQRPTPAGLSRDYIMLGRPGSRSGARPPPLTRGRSIPLPAGPGGSPLRG